MLSVLSCYLLLLLFFFQTYHISVPAYRGLHFFRLSQKCVRCLFKSADHESNSLILICLCFALVLVVTTSILVPKIELKSILVWVTNYISIVGRSGSKTLTVTSKLLIHTSWCTLSIFCLDFSALWKLTVNCMTGKYLTGMSQICLYISVKVFSF